MDPLIRCRGSERVCPNDMKDMGSAIVPKLIRFSTNIGGADLHRPHSYNLTCDRPPKSCGVIAQYDWPRQCFFVCDLGLPAAAKKESSNSTAGRRIVRINRPQFERLNQDAIRHSLNIISHEVGPQNAAFDVVKLACYDAICRSGNDGVCGDERGGRIGISAELCVTCSAEKQRGSKKNFSAHNSR